MLRAHAAEADHAELHPDLLQSYAHDPPAALLERREVAGGLARISRAEAERAARDRQLLAGVVDDLDEEAGVRAALVQLPGRVQVARAEPERDDAAGLARARRRAARARPRAPGRRTPGSQT